MSCFLLECTCLCSMGITVYFYLSGARDYMFSKKYVKVHRGLACGTKLARMDLIKFLEDCL